jgi:SAM-dependent methyltransferase
VKLTSSYPAVLKRIPQQIRLGRILEIGPGRLRPGLELLKDRDVELVAIGYTDAEAAEGQAAIRRMGARPRADYLAGGLDRFPLPDQSVDAVISFGSLHAWRDPLLVLDEIARVLKQGGEVILGDVSADAGWMQTVLAGILAPHLRALYGPKESRVKTADAQALVEQSSLSGLSVQVIGPDIWISNTAL